MKKMLLCGYMGSGKSTIAKALSDKIQIPAIDLDEAIEQQSGISVREIFELKGEIYFRKIESRLFQELLQQPVSLIIALGGGTPVYAGNHLLMQSDFVVSFYLKASIATLANRLEKEMDHRPLLAGLNSESLREYIAKHLFERDHFYRHATHTVSIDGKTTDQIVAEIINFLA